MTKIERKERVKKRPEPKKVKISELKRGDYYKHSLADTNPYEIIFKVGSIEFNTGDAGPSVVIQHVQHRIVEHDRQDTLVYHTDRAGNLIQEQEDHVKEVRADSLKPGTVFKNSYGELYMVRQPRKASLRAEWEEEMGDKYTVAAVKLSDFISTGFMGDRYVTPVDVSILVFE